MTDPAERGAFSLFESSYDDLRKVARARLLRGPRGPLLDTTSLVHESFLRIASARNLKVQDRAHFFRYAAHVMRSVIVDTVRTRMAARRGGDAPHVTFTGRLLHAAPSDSGEAEIVRVHEALDQLAQHDGRLAQLVELRYFAGLTDAEIAEALGTTDRTVRRQWEKARLLLHEALA